MLGCAARAYDYRKRATGRFVSWQVSLRRAMAIPRLAAPDRRHLRGEVRNRTVASRCEPASILHANGGRSFVAPATDWVTRMFKGRVTFSRQTVAPLLRALGDDVESVRVSALRAIIRLPLTTDVQLEVAGVLHALLRDDIPQEDVIEFAARVPVRTVRERLYQLLHSADARTRERTALALARVGDQSALEPLVRRLGTDAQGWWQWPSLRARLGGIIPLIDRWDNTAAPDSDAYARMNSARCLTMLRLSAAAKQRLRKSNAVDACAEVRLFTGIALAREGETHALVEAIESFDHGTHCLVGDPLLFDELIDTTGAVPEEAAKRLRAMAKDLDGFKGQIACTIANTAERVAREYAEPEDERISSGAGGTRGGGPPTDRLAQQAKSLAHRLIASDVDALLKSLREQPKSLDILVHLDAIEATRLVTRLFEIAGAAPEELHIELGNSIMDLIAKLAGSLAPDVPALYRATLGASETLRLQASWVASRVPIEQCIDVLADALVKSAASEEREAAAWLIENATRYATQAYGPHFGGGSGPPDVVEVGRELIDDTRSDELTIVRPALGEGGSRGIPEPITDQVHFTVGLPSSAAPNDAFVIDLFAHLASQRAEVIERIRESQRVDEPTLRTKGDFTITRGTELHATLHAPGLEILQGTDVLTWEGRLGNASFLVHVPVAARARTQAAWIELHAHQLRVIRVDFIVRVGERHPEPVQTPLEVARYRTAFASYASVDRDEVLGRVQGMQKISPELDIFVDVASLRSGQNWREALRSEVVSREVLYLFWSKAASQSKWVTCEWNWALEEHGIDHIDPVPLVDPRLAPPPQKLADRIHFNDWVLAYMRGETG